MRFHLLYMIHSEREQDHLQKDGGLHKPQLLCVYKYQEYNCDVYSVLFLCLPLGEYPSCLHTTFASLLSREFSQNEPQTPFKHIKTLPSLTEEPFTNATS